MSTLSLRLYNRLLALYPEDLRRDYGHEMLLAFADDLETSRRERGVRGACGVWLATVSEFFRIALPEHASSPAVRVPALSFAFTLLSFGGETLMALWHGHPKAYYLGTTGAVLVMLSLASPAISLLSVWVCRGGTSLSIGSLIDQRGER